MRNRSFVNAWLLRAAASTLLLAVAAGAAMSCPTFDRFGRPFTCPDKARGWVVADGRYDVDDSRLDDGRYVLDRDELQCAIDCLDGDVEPDQFDRRSNTGDIHAQVLSGRPGDGLGVYNGAVLNLTNDVVYRLERGGLNLPFGSYGQVVLEGHGAVIELDAGTLAAGTHAVLARAAPTDAAIPDLEVMIAIAAQWRFRDVTLRVANEAARRQDVKILGMELQGLGMPFIERCQFEGGFDTAIDMRFVLLPHVRDCAFRGNVGTDIGVFEDADSPRAPDCCPSCPTPGTCWFPPRARVDTDGDGDVECPLVDVNLGGTVVNTCGNLFGGGTGVTVTGSNGARVEGTLHEFGRNAQVAARALDLHRSDALSIVGMAARGERPHELIRSTIQNDPNGGCMVRAEDLYVAVNADVPPAAQGYLVETTSPHPLFLERLHLRSPADPQRLLHLGYPNDSRFLGRNWTGMNDGTRLAGLGVVHRTVDPLTGVVTITPVEGTCHGFTTFINAPADWDPHAFEHWEDGHGDGLWPDTPIAMREISPTRHAVQWLAGIIDPADPVPPAPPRDGGLAGAFGHYVRGQRCGLLVCLDDVCKAVGSGPPMPPRPVPLPPDGDLPPTLMRDGADCY
jgi:hypothetical protein